MVASKLVKKWETGRDDLGLDIVVPYHVGLGNNVTVRAEFLVRNFGAENGTLVFTDTDAVWPHRKELLCLGYGYSVLDEPTDVPNERYDRELFIEMLSEWGWTGREGDKPDWVRTPPEDEES